MAINPSVMEKGLNAIYQRAASQLETTAGATPELMNVATVVPSSSQYEKYGWLGDVPSVREWLGEARAGQLKDYDYTIRNRTFETSILINRDNMDDDQVGAFDARVRDLAQRIAAHPAKLISDLIINGDSNLAYDGLAFFANASGARTIDNLLGGTGTTVAQIQADIQTAITAMMKFTNDAGEVLNIVPDTIVCPVAVSYNMMRAVMSAADPAVSAGVDTFNPLYNRFRVIPDARLDGDDANDWYIFATGYAVRPFIVQNRESAQTEFERVPNTRDYVYRAWMRGNAGYGFPHMAAKVVNS